MFVSILLMKNINYLVSRDVYCNGAAFWSNDLLFAKITLNKKMVGNFYAIYF